MPSHYYNIWLQMKFSQHPVDEEWESLSLCLDELEIMPIDTARDRSILTRVTSNLTLFIVCAWFIQTWVRINHWSKVRLKKWSWFFPPRHLNSRVDTDQEFMYLFIYLQKKLLKYISLQNLWSFWQFQLILMHKAFWEWLSCQVYSVCCYDHCYRPSVSLHHAGAPGQDQCGNVSCFLSLKL